VERSATRHPFASRAAGTFRSPDLQRLFTIIVIPGAEQSEAARNPLNAGLWKMDSGLAACGVAPE